MSFRTYQFQEGFAQHKLYLCKFALRIFSIRRNRQPIEWRISFDIIAHQCDLIFRVSSRLNMLHVTYIRTVCVQTTRLEVLSIAYTNRHIPNGYVRLERNSNGRISITRLQNRIDVANHFATRPRSGLRRHIGYMVQRSCSQPMSEWIN